MLSARHRIARVVYGAVDERLGALGSWIDLSEQLQTHPFHALQSVTGGVLAPQSSALMRQFFKQVLDIIPVYCMLDMQHLLLNLQGQCACALQFLCVI
jgi:hypothetical protein